MAETGKRIIIGLFEIDKNADAMPALAGEELGPDDNFELDSNGDLMPKSTETD